MKRGVRSVGESNIKILPMGLLWFCMSWERYLQKRRFSKDMMDDTSKTSPSPSAENVADKVLVNEAVAPPSNNAAENINEDEQLWGYGGVGKMERDLRRMMGVTRNPAVMRDEIFRKPGREWRELDQGGFITLPDWLKQYETNDLRGWKEFNALLKKYDIEDDDGTDVDEKWRKKAVDRLMFEDAFIHGCNIEEIDFIVGSDYIKDVREERMIKRAKMNKLEGENTEAAFKRLYPDEGKDEDLSAEDRYFFPPRMSESFLKKRFRRA